MDLYVGSTDVTYVQTREKRTNGTGFGRARVAVPRGTYHAIESAEPDLTVCGQPSATLHLWPDRSYHWCLAEARCLDCVTGLGLH